MMTNSEHAKIRAWADDQCGTVALHLRQELLPVEGPDAVIFPPTYAIDDKYVIDKLGDGTKVALIDSVGSQANRMEPLFKEYPQLVPQFEVELSTDKTVSILDAGHRLGDALIRSTTTLADCAKSAFAALEGGDAVPIAKLAPTSLVFGVWDSRGSGQKLPRLINSVIRAWDVQCLTRAATYIPPVDYAQLGVFTEQEGAKAERSQKNPLAQRGFVHHPSDDVGGIVVRGGIFRDVTVNLIALRKLNGPVNGPELRRYILGLTLVAATNPQDGFLRQGCLLVPDSGSPASWTQVARTGERETISLPFETALDYAEKVASNFGVGKGTTYAFDKDLAKEDTNKKKNS